jgi:hypothetical protein
MMKNSLIILVISLIVLTKITWANDFPEYRGQCVTSWVKDASRNLDWEAIHQENQQAKRARALMDETDVEVGDTMTFWSWNLSVMPPVWIRVPATCRAVGDSCYIFVADNQWNVHMTQANVDTVLEHFEHHTLNFPNQGIVQLDVENFGTIPDELDNDRHVYIFYSALGSFGGSVFDGYFSVYNEMTEAQAQAQGAHSNEVEMFYMTCYPLAPAAPARLSVLAHELEHMIHWNEDPNEETWVDEGCAEFAMWLYGLPDPITGFPSNPDDNLLVWGQQWTDYIECYLFFMYLHDQYGGPDMIRTVVEEPQNGQYGVQQALQTMGYSGVTFEDVFVDWTIANYMDDITYADGKYGYFNIDLPIFAASYCSSFPVPATNATVNSWAADYVVFRNAYNLQAEFDGADNTIFGLPFVTYSTEIDTVIYGELSSGNAGSFPFPGFGIDYDNVLMVVSRISSSGSSSYQYSATADASGVPSEAGSIAPVSFKLISVYPNPFNPTTTVAFEMPQAGNVELAVYDILGREVFRSENFVPSTGLYQIPIRADGWSSGIYWVRLNYQGVTASAKIVFLK